MAAGRGSPAADEFLSATEHGRICALAAECQRDVQACADAYPTLFSSRHFDARLFSTVAMANAFGSPWATAPELRMVVRATMWSFAADWRIDYVAKTRAEVDTFTTRCLAVAEGVEPATGEPITDFLADILGELAKVPGAEAGLGLWRDQLERWLAAMAREWDWKAALSADGGTALPTFEEYLDNADNYACSWVNVSHWIFGGDPGTFDHLGELWEASQAVQRVMRLQNDLATYRRDVEWGDLNVLMLGIGRAEVTARIAVLLELAMDLIRPLRLSRPRQAVYLERQIGYSGGFYGLTDYWSSS
jgi:hypothetical protein